MLIYAQNLCLFMVKIYEHKIPKKWAFMSIKSEKKIEKMTKNCRKQCLKMYKKLKSCLKMLSKIKKKCQN